MKRNVLFISSPKSWRGGRAGRAGAEVPAGSPQPHHQLCVCPLLLAGPLGFPSTAPPHARVLAASLGLPQPGACLPILWTSATPTHLRCLSSLCCGIYLNVSLILHPPPQGGIKLTEKEQMQSRAKLVITIKLRENQSRDTQFDSPSLPFFKLPFFFLFLLL